MKITQTDMLEMLQNDDVVVVLRPDMEDGKWSGNLLLKLAYLASEDSSLTRKEQGQLLSVGAMVAASLPVMSDSDDVYYELSDYVMENMPDLIEEYIDASQEEEKGEAATHVTKDGNVYTLSFNSKTEGNA